MKNAKPGFKTNRLTFGCKTHCENCGMFSIKSNGGKDEKTN
jgi:hypothetical protein